ncbi:HK97 family phage prohead protease [Zalerion maritima]|uniref:HK97 family phage prohead protease n=1 Tax=Zalerion maritima TaxID=339359 RepID=A0AAD5WW99_9PEZI|nr:HK97 family phage prohead protease [Zalerion maritima]
MTPLVTENKKLNKRLETELTDYSISHRNGESGPYADNITADALIVGAGFGGVFVLKTLRDLGLKATILEAGSDLGGTWRWNCYPGANVDSEVPEYEYSWPEVYNTWNWPNNYPNYENLRDYFDHVDKVMHIKKDCAFNTVVVGAQFDVDEGVWNVQIADGRKATSKYLIVCAGFAAKRYIPDWKGIETFKGVVHHSSFWPDEEVPVEGKRCAVIGTGATGVQVTQAWGPKCGSLKVFQRTPNLAIPMQKRDLGAEEQQRGKMWYPQLMEYREECFGGFLYTFKERNTFDDTPEQRRAFYEELYRKGGFRFWLANYKDYLFDAAANREAYNFWVERTRARIGDSRLRDLLAPRDMPHFFGVKRPCLEQTYYEQFNRENVDLVDIKNNAIVEFSEKGIKLQDGTELEFDVICIATGFDIVSGGMTSMGLRNVQGASLRDEWKAQANTYLGVTISGYPNMFHTYGTHGPTLLSNGPTTTEIQGRWIADCIAKLEREKIRYFNPTPDATRKWKQHINELSDKSLFPTTKSTYMGGSLPGKAFEQVNFAGGMAAYKKEIREALDTWAGFELVG